MSGAGGQATRLVLERISRAVESLPGATGPTIRKRAGVSRRSGDEALELLVRAGFVERQTVHAEWHYRSIKAYRAAAFAPKPEFGSSHSTGMGRGG